MNEYQSNPVVLHYYDQDEGYSPREEFLVDGEIPAITDEAVDAFLDIAEQEVGQEGSGLFLAQAAFAFRKMEELDHIDKRTRRRCAKVVVDLFLGQDKSLELPTVLHALASLPDDMLRERSEVHLRVGSAPMFPKNVEVSSAHFQEACRLAKQLMQRDEAQWPLLVRALTKLGDEFRNDKQFKRAIPYYERALTVARDHGGEQLTVFSAFFVATARLGLGTTHLDLGNVAEAEEHLSAAEGILRQQDLAPQRQVLGAVLLTRAKLDIQNGKFADAEDKLGQALEYLREGSPWTDWALAACYESLRQVMEEIKRPELEDLERKAMREDGLLAATGVGGEEGDAMAMMRIEEENAKMVWKRSPDEDDAPATLTERQDIDLLRLLNLDAELIESRVAYLKQHIANGTAFEHSLRGADFRLVPEAWRAVRIMQDVAVALLDKRPGNGVDWLELLDAGSVSREGMLLQLHREPSSLEKIMGYCVEVRVEPYELDQRAIMEGSSVAERLIKLHSSLEKWLKTRGETAERLQVRWSLALPHFRRKEVGVIANIYRYGGKPWYRIGGPPHPRQQPLISLTDLEPLEVMVPLPDEQRALEDRFFGNYGLTLVEQRSGVRSARLVPRVAEAFERLVSSVLIGKPKIGYCQMPRGEAGYLDELLGEPHEPFDYCNTFYWTPYGRPTCGKSTCRTYHRDLHADLPGKLFDRAKQLASRESRSRGGASADELWKEAKKAHPDDPQMALQFFRSKLPPNDR